MGVDDIDRRLVELLGENGRRAYTEMAVDLGVSEATVRSRVRSLTTSGVLRIVALCNPLTLGHQSVRLLVGVRDLTPRSVARTLADQPMINHVALCAGAHDLYLEATCRDLRQLVELLDELRRTPGVARIDQLVMTQLYKDYSWVGLRDSRGRRTTDEAGPSARSSERRVP